MPTVSRNSKLAVVINGSVYVVTSSSASLATGGEDALDAAALIYSTPAYGKIYYVDGTNYKVFDPTTNTVSTWSPEDGSLPVSGSDTARLIDLYRGRIVLSGLAGDEHNWFMSRVADPLDFDYAPAVTTETQAVAGNNSEAGEIGDVITSLAPINDDLMLFGGDHTIWRLTGDPMAGGRIDLVSDVTGMAWGRAWCKDSGGNVYFFGSKGGVYRIAGGLGAPERLTRDRIEERLANIDLTSHVVRMVWNERELGLHVFISPSNSATATTHYFWDMRADAWWPDVFADTNHNPLAVHLFDGDDPSDRAILLGGRDGYLRKWDIDADDDDGSAIASHVLMGPFRADDKPFKVSEIQCALSSGSDPVTCTVQVGDTAEEAFNASAAFTATFSAGRNHTVHPQRRGYAAYIKIANSTLDRHWALEKLQANLAVIEGSHGRQFDG